MAGHFHPDPLALAIEVEGPGVVAVTGQDQQVGPGLERGLHHPVARGGIAVPGVHVPGQAVLRCAGGNRDPLFQPVGRFGRHPLGQVLRHGEVAHDHLLDQHLPRLVRFGAGLEPLREPGFLRLAQQAAGRIAPGPVAEGGQRRIGLAGSGAIEDLAEIERLVARQMAGFKPEQRGEIAHLVAGIVIVRNRQPFAIGLFRSGLAHRPVALVRLVVFGPVLPGVVGGFVVVPDGDGRVELVQPLQVGVGTIGGKALAVLRQGHRLVHRQQPLGQSLLFARIDPALVFVEIVAEVQREVEVPRLAGVAIGVEPAEAIVGAGKHRDPEPGHLADRQGPGPPGDRGFARSGDEPVVIPLPRLQSARPGLGAAIVGRRCAAFALRCDPGELRILGHFPFELAVLPGGIAGPQQHPVRPGLAAGDAVGKALCPLRQRRRAAQPGQPQQPELERIAAIGGQCRGLRRGGRIAERHGWFSLFRPRLAGIWDRAMAGCDKDA